MVTKILSLRSVWRLPFRIPVLKFVDATSTKIEQLIETWYDIDQSVINHPPSIIHQTPSNKSSSTLHPQHAPCAQPQLTHPSISPQPFSTPQPISKQPNCPSQPKPSIPLHNHTDHGHVACSHSGSVA